MIRYLGDWESDWRCKGERALLRVLEGGCSVPVGVETEIVHLHPDPSASTAVHPMTGRPTTHIPPPSARFLLHACVTSLDGMRSIHHSAEAIVRSSRECEELGERVATELFGRGAKEILEEIDRSRGEIGMSPVRVGKDAESM